MTVRKIIIASVFVAVLLTVTVVGLLRPANVPTTWFSIAFLGYTNQANGCQAVFQITNHTPGTFQCLVGPRVSEASRAGRPVFCDPGEAAPPGLLLGRDTFTFAVAAAPDTNRLRVSVEVRDARSPDGGLRPLLRRFGIHTFKRHSQTLTSPAFSRPS
jgi:hypothetical protein